MKNVIDTNPFITACVSDRYKEKIIKYLQDQNSLTVLTIYNEIEDKLLMLHMALLGFENFSIKGDKSLLLNLPMFKDIKNISDEIYDFLTKSDEVYKSPYKILMSIGVLLSKFKKLA